MRQMDEKGKAKARGDPIATQLEGMGMGVEVRVRRRRRVHPRRQEASLTWDG